MIKMAEILLRTSEVMNSQQFHHSTYLAVKELLATPTWKYSHSCSQIQHTADIPQVEMTGDGNYKIPGTYVCISSGAMFIESAKCLLHTLDLATFNFGSIILMCPDVLLYYSEAFLPFLKIFYSDFCQVSQGIGGVNEKKMSSALLVGNQF